MLCISYLVTLVFQFLFNKGFADFFVLYVEVLWTQRICCSTASHEVAKLVCTFCKYLHVSLATMKVFLLGIRLHAYLVTKKSLEMFLYHPVSSCKQLKTCRQRRPKTIYLSVHHCIMAQNLCCPMMSPTQLLDCLLKAPLTGTRSLHLAFRSRTYPR